MSTHSISTRRSFLKAGALVAAPIAMPAAAAAAAASSDAEARLARREDEEAIRNLHHGWMRRLNAGDEAGRSGLADDLRGIAPDHAAEPDAIALAADGRTATGRFHCTVELECAIPDDFTLGQMAHAQGSGFVRSSERRILDVSYRKTAEGWTIAKLAFA